MIPQTFSSSTTLIPGQETRPQFYKSILENISVNGTDEIPQKTSSNKTNLSEEWGICESTIEKGKASPMIKSEGIGPFVRGFADPAVM